jgi:hypothetical protein
MFKILLFIILFFILIGGLFGFSFSRFIFGGPSQTRRPQAQNSQSKKKQTQSEPKKSKKIINPDEGEYVDYEEIKD